MGSEIPLNANFLGLSCQLGGLTLNGNVAQGTAQSYNVITINDPAVMYDSSGFTRTTKFLPVKIAGAIYYMPLYQ